MPVFPPEVLTATTGPIAGRSFNGEVEDIRLNNELVRVTGQPALDPSFVIEFWDGTAWRTKGLWLWLASDAIAFQKVSILENRPEVCTVQFEHSITAGGRTTVDVTLRRGMRTALFQMSNNAPINLGVTPYPTEAMTKTNERELSNAADANGHKLMLGSPRTWVHGPTTGFIIRTAAQTFSFYVGLQLSGAVSGDTALDLSMQSCGWLSELVRPNRR